MPNAMKYAIRFVSILIVLFLLPVFTSTIVNAVAGVPAAPIVIFTEDFENRVGNSPVLLSNYTGPVPLFETYTGDPAWISGPACNGIIINANATSALGCGFLKNLKVESIALGVLNGTPNPNNNHSLTAYTAGNPGADKIEFETEIPIPLTTPNRYLTFSLNAFAQNCAIAAHPQFKFYLMNGSTAISAFSSPIDPCTLPGGKGHYHSNAPILFSGASVGIRLINGQGSGLGNDASVDDISLEDVTPRLDKKFVPSVVVTGKSSKLTYTVTNSSALVAIPSWSFVDTLPAGLIVATPSNATTNCTSGAITSTSSKVTVSGKFNSGQSFCTMTIDVKMSADGVVNNCPANVTTVGLINLTGCSSLTSNGSFAKSGSVIAGPNAGSTSTTTNGDTVLWKLVFDNLTNVSGFGNISDVITADQTFVPGSLEIPPNWSGNFSTNSGVSYVPAEPASGVNAVQGAFQVGQKAGYRIGTTEFTIPATGDAVAHFQVVPQKYYCASSTPTINGWNNLKMTNLSSTAFTTALLTIRDKLGNIVAPYNSFDVTTAIKAGTLSLASIPYSGNTTDLTFDLHLVNPTGAQFALSPAPVVSVDWDGPGIEMCFKVKVNDVCSIADVKNIANLTLTSDVGVTLIEAASDLLDYVASANCINITKTIPNPPILNADGTYDVTYLLQVQNTSPAQTTYNLNDNFSWGSGITFANPPDVSNTVPGDVPLDPTWDGATHTLLASNVQLDGLETQKYSVTATATVPLNTSSANGDCTLSGAETGTGLLNNFSIDVAGTTKKTSGCAPVSGLTITKSVLSPPVYNNDGTVTIVYSIAVTNTGTANTEYDLSDSLKLGTGITPKTVSFLSSAPGSVLDNTFDGVANTTITTGKTIFAGVTDTYKLQLIANLPLKTSATISNCVLDPGETGTGLMNSTTLSRNGVTASADTCAPVPSIDIVKTVSSGPTPGATTGTVDLVYEIDVTNSGPGTGPYSLDEKLKFGNGITINSAIITQSPAGITPNASWNGLTNTNFVGINSIPGNTTHKYKISINAKVLLSISATDGDCTLAAGESGTGFLNEATLNSNSLSTTTNACTALGGISITKTVSKQPVNNNDGTVTLEYTINVVSTGSVSQTYDLDDKPLLGGGITLVNASVISSPAGSVPNPGWNGNLANRLISSRTIPGNSTDTYVIRATAKVPINTAPSQADCVQEIPGVGTGLFNDAHMVVNGIVI